ncbi:MAG: hypothetical protein ACOYZ8_06355 [Chloroflexota bacterium]
MTAEPEKTLSALERLLLEPEPPARLVVPPLRRGELCPQCGEGRLDYNGTLDLACPVCGFTSGGGGGCT